MPQLETYGVERVHFERNGPLVPCVAWGEISEIVIFCKISAMHLRGVMFREIMVDVLSELPSVIPQLWVGATLYQVLCV